MALKRPATRKVKASAARQNWSALINEVHGGDSRVLVEKDGIPVAGIISAADLERLRLLESERERNFSFLDELRDAFKDVPENELEDQIAKALEEIRQEPRAMKSG